MRDTKSHSSSVCILKWFYFRLYPNILTLVSSITLAIYMSTELNEHVMQANAGWFTIHKRGTRSLKMTCFSQNSEDFGWPLRSAWSICPSVALWNWTDWLSLRFLRLIAPLRLSDPISQYRGTEGGHFLVKTHSLSSAWKTAVQRQDRSAVSHQSTSVLKNCILFDKHQSTNKNTFCNTKYTNK